MHSRMAVLLWLAIIFLISAPASASIEVLQGDTIYLGETVDISRVMSWSGQFAYFQSGEFGDTPTKIVDVNEVGHMYTYYIDPAKYNVGTWYKWDGKEDSHGNMLAFYIAPGIRPYNTTITRVNNTVIKATEPDLTPPENPQDTHLLLARGDTGTLRYHLSESPENGLNPLGYIWLFGDMPQYDQINKNSGRLLGVPMAYEPNGSINSFVFTPEMSAALQEGWYSGFIQFTGVNRRQDVFYDKEKNNLDSPYKDVEAVNLDAFTPLRVEQEFIKLQQAPQYSDDILIPISVELVTPAISIGDYWEESDSIVIRGSTPLSNGTVISVMIDPDQHVLQRDIKANTFNTTVEYRMLEGKTIRESECISVISELNKGGYNATTYNGTSYNQTEETNVTFANRSPLINPAVPKTKCTSIPRIFSIRIPIVWDDMAIGQHWIRATVSNGNVKASMTKDFLISGKWVSPTPTMDFKKMVVIKQGQTPVSHNETLENVPVTANVTPEETLHIIYITPTPYENSSGSQTAITPLPTTSPKTESPVSNPISIIIAAIIVVLLIFVGWLYWG